MGLFYELVDGPSRDVAFRNWGWYYSSVQGVWIAALGLFCAFVGSVLRPVEDQTLRGIAFLLLVVGLIFTQWVWMIWVEKTRDHAELQLIQIAPKLAGEKVGTSCRLGAECPSR